VASTLLPLDVTIDPEEKRRAIVRRIQAALIPSIVPRRPPDDVILDTLEEIVADPRVSAALNDEASRFVGVIQRVEDILSRRNRNNDWASLDELWEFMDADDLNNALATIVQDEQVHVLVRRMFEGPYRHWNDEA
jgi:hypothetical protein